MVFELTPENAGNSLVILFVGYFLALIFQVYMLYLNWKQSKVKDTTTELITEVKKIRLLIERGSKAGSSRK